MGHFLRCAVSTRMTKFLLEPLKNDTLKDFRQLTRFFASRGSTDHEDPDFSKKAVEDSYLADLDKFIHQDKLKLPRTNVKQEDYDLAPSNDANTFGTIVKSNPYLLQLEKHYADDWEEMEYSSQLPNYLPQVEYANKIKKYLHQRRFADALDVLQVTMLKEHRVKPEYYIYSILIAYCGQTGYTKMAFKLFNDMKKRGLPVKPSVYTSLFNSCSNSPFPSDGLTRTRKLFALMIEKDILPNQITCHSIIKAFARCGSVDEAFKVVDYMMSRHMEIKSETMSFAFHACISDKEAGFRHALLVYRKMNEYQIKPDIIHFNLLLHCLRDCSIGDLDSTIDVLKRLGVENVDKLSSRKVEQPLLTDGFPWEEDEKFSHQIVAGINRDTQLQEHTGEVTPSRKSDDLLPNLFLKSPTLGCIVSLTEMETPQDRLFLLGGVEGFLKEMARHNVEPDIKTISLLLECIPDTCTAENNLLKLIDKLKLKTDLLFFNTLIRRRAFRKQYSEAREILSKLAARGFQPDMMTYTNLAMTCEKYLDACELLKAIDDSGLRPNIESLTSLLGNAVRNFQMKYIDLILKVIDYEEMKVNKRFMDKLERFYQSCSRALKTRPDSFSPMHKDSIQNFCKSYPQWIEKVEKEEQTHPWQHLRERQPDSESNKEFLNNHVERHSLKPNFPRLGPNTNPKVRKAKVRRLKEENPEMFQKDFRKGSIVQKLEGLTSVQYQQIGSPNQNDK